MELCLKSPLLEPKQREAPQEKIALPRTPVPCSSHPPQQMGSQWCPPQHLTGGQHSLQRLLSSGSHPLQHPRKGNLSQLQTNPLQTGIELFHVCRRKTRL